MFHFLASSMILASAASAAVFNVTVGSGGFVFTPNSIIAQNGDVVTFLFTGSPGNHTVSQASFAAPCQQLSGGFDSGYVFVPTGFTGEPAQWNLTILDSSKPLWFYCKQTAPSPHCLNGMVGAINPPSSGNTLANFVSASKALSSLPPQTPGNLTGVGAAASAAPSPLASASGTSSAASATGTAPSASGSASASASSSTALKASSTSLWTLLAGVLGLVIV